MHALILRDTLRPGWLAAAWAIAMCGGCANTTEVDPLYRPAENVLEVVSVLRAHISDDTYRFESAHDFTGRNVYRSSLLRLENLERLHGDALRAGRPVGDVIPGADDLLDAGSDV